MTVDNPISDMAAALANLILNGWTANPTPEVKVIYGVKRQDTASFGGVDTILIYQESIDEDNAVDVGAFRFTYEVPCKVEILTSEDRPRLMALFNEVRRIIYVNRRGIPEQQASAGKWLYLGQSRDMSDDYAKFFRIIVPVRIKTWYAKVEP